MPPFQYQNFMNKTQRPQNDSLDQYLQQIKEERANRPSLTRASFNFDMTPELKEIIQGTHRVDNSRMNALRDDYDQLMGSIKPFRGPMDQNYRNQQDALREQVQGGQPPQGPQLGVGASSMAPPSRGLGMQQREKDFSYGKPTRKSAASGILGHIGDVLSASTRKSKKKPVRNEKGEMMYDSSGQPIMARKNKGKGHKAMSMVANAIGNYGPQLFDYFSQKKDKKKRRQDASVPDYGEE
jgi:hypothetical protein